MLKKLSPVYINPPKIKAEKIFERSIDKKKELKHFWYDDSTFIIATMAAFLTSCVL